tara:strand:+ start:1422 stop:1547 length:126 start_codon:yes stop_codon:yes gene_type:complete
MSSTKRSVALKHVKVDIYQITDLSRSLGGFFRFGGKMSNDS